MCVWWTQWTRGRRLSKECACQHVSCMREAAGLAEHRPAAAVPPSKPLAVRQPPQRHVCYVKLAHVLGWRTLLHPRCHTPTEEFVLLPCCHFEHRLLCLQHLCNCGTQLALQPPSQSTLAGSGLQRPRHLRHFGQSPLWGHFGLLASLARPPTRTLASLLQKRQASQPHLPHPTLLQAALGKAKVLSAPIANKEWGGPPCPAPRCPPATRTPAPPTCACDARHRSACSSGIASIQSLGKLCNL